jgi:hypothetical protein
MIYVKHDSEKDLLSRSDTPTMQAVSSARAMTTPAVPAAPSPVSSATAHAGAWRARAASGWWWLQGALLLAGAAQVIIISALVSVDPPPSGGRCCWPSPRHRVTAAAFGPAPANRLATAAGLLVLAAGIAEGIGHAALFFVPTLAVLAVGGVKLWRVGLLRPGRPARFRCSRASAPNQVTVGVLAEQSPGQPGEQFAQLGVLFGGQVGEQLAQPFPPGREQPVGGRVTGAGEYQRPVSADFH